MKNRLKKYKLGLISFLVPLISIFVIPYEKVSELGYALGFPIQFVIYRSYDGFVGNRFLLFTPTEFIKTEFNVVNYLIAVLMVYVILKIIKKVITGLKSTKHNPIEER
ncbi:hypothetical protein VL08_17480 [Bacillus subtilis]|uniref:hypothetical protein n=1 Tax=Bacillus TaxID=1386 RepID=UPI00065CF982|nr:hypothetical protein [Bacillus subtilis]AWX20951.1 hypothetical protein CXF51_01320 [Bacillus subtilis subsp. subtilis]KAF1680577.1 hypothetical protein BTW01_04500 [Bacillus sp. SKDU12]KMN93428.1 hypothetical protein VL08_17480 [Bacillus subtilis]MDP8527923.1 hypothetical protein [Bacillus subtilis]MED1760967.1 hypothetical protein [Bacillus subtilis]